MGLRRRVSGWRCRDADEVVERERRVERALLGEKTRADHITMFIQMLLSNINLSTGPSPVKLWASLSNYLQPFATQSFSNHLLYRHGT